MMIPVFYIYMYDTSVGEGGPKHEERFLVFYCMYNNQHCSFPVLRRNLAQCNHVNNIWDWVPVGNREEPDPTLMNKG